MQRMLGGFGLLLLLAGSAQSGHDTCNKAPCPYEVQIASVAAEKSYGLLVRAPEEGCRRVRYRVETTGQVPLGKTPALAAGEVAVVRMGKGFPAGANILVVIADGCGKAPTHLRLVTLHKTSPDHGWRAARTLATPPLSTLHPPVDVRPSSLSSP